MNPLKRYKRRLTGQNIQDLADRVSAWRVRELETAQDISLPAKDRDHAATVAVALSTVLFMIDDFDGCPDFNRWLQPLPLTRVKSYRVKGNL